VWGIFGKEERIVTRMCRYQAIENGSTYEREKIVGTVRWRMFGQNNVVTGGWVKLHNDEFR
jgi:hypothetical protein